MDCRGHCLRLLHRLCAAGLLAWISTARAQSGPLETSAAEPVAIGLDTVLRLADEQNPQVLAGRAKVQAACAESALVAKKCLHDPCEYHSRKLKAEADIWQSRAELSRLTYETLLDATGTYIDLVAIRQIESEIGKLHKELSELLARAAKLAEKEPGIRVEVARLRAETAARQQLIRRLQAQGDAAAAKLAYLLGLDSCDRLAPVDSHVVPIDLVDVSEPACDLVAQALTQGPGITDTENLLALVEDAAVQAQKSRLLSCLPGGRARQKLAGARHAEAYYAYYDLRGKLAAGVLEAREAILAGAEEIRLTTDQVNHAGAARKLSRERLDNNIAGSSYGEVLLSLQALGLAHASHVNSLRDHNKAQLRLMFLTGGGQPCAAPLALPPPGE